MMAKTFPLFSASSFMRRTLRTDTPAGFSISTCWPARNASTAAMGCISWGAATITASVKPEASISSWVAKTGMPVVSRRRSSRFCGSMSHRAATDRPLSGCSSIQRKCALPMFPIPIRPIRTDGVVMVKRLCFLSLLFCVIVSEIAFRQPRILLFSSLFRWLPRAR